MIKIQNIVKKYSNNFTLTIDHLVIGNQEIVGIIGNNGSGKSTLLRLILDLIEPSCGTISINGKNISRDETWKKNVGSYLDSSFLMEFLTPYEYLHFVGSIYKLENAKIAEEIISMKEFFGSDISTFASKYIRNYSDGNIQKIGIAGAIIIKPEILILDEPYINLDPSSQMNLNKILIGLNKKNSTSILLSSHNLKYISDICTRIIIIEGGQIIEDSLTDSATFARLEKYFIANT